MVTFIRIGLIHVLFGKRHPKKQNKTDTFRRIPNFLPYNGSIPQIF